MTNSSPNLLKMAAPMKKFCWRVSSQIIGVSRQFSASSRTKYGKCDSEVTACLDMIGLNGSFSTEESIHSMPLLYSLDWSRTSLSNLYYIGSTN